MNQLLFGFIVAAAFYANSGAEAAPPVTESITGVIAGQNTTGTAGYFGPAGANLSGSAGLTLRWYGTEYAKTSFS